MTECAVVIAGPQSKGTRILWRGLTEDEARRLVEDKRLGGRMHTLFWRRMDAIFDWRWHEDNGSYDVVLEELGVKPQRKLKKPDTAPGKQTGPQTGPQAEQESLARSVANWRKSSVEFRTSMDSFLKQLKNGEVG